MLFLDPTDTLFMYFFVFHNTRKKGVVRDDRLLFLGNYIFFGISTLLCFYRLCLCLYSENQYNYESEHECRGCLAHVRGDMCKQD